jgi:hypothetical protein
VVVSVKAGSVAVVLCASAFDEHIKLTVLAKTHKLGGRKTNANTKLARRFKKTFKRLKFKKIFIQEVYLRMKSIAI